MYHLRAVDAANATIPASRPYRCLRDHADHAEAETIISKREGADILKEEALKEGMHTLRMSATDYVLDGTTSFSEMVKVSFDV